MTTMYLAWQPSGHCTLAPHADEGPVDLLVSFVVLKQFVKLRKDYNIGKIIMDSGAFSVFKSGKIIDIDEYIAACKDLEGDFDEFVGLDVIGNPREGITDVDGMKRNLSKMWEAGVKAIPVYHQSEPIEHLDWCCANAHKIGLASRLPK